MTQPDPLRYLQITRGFGQAKCAGMLSNHFLSALMVNRPAFAGRSRPPALTVGPARGVCRQARCGRPPGLLVGCLAAMARPYKVACPPKYPGPRPFIPKHTAKDRAQMSRIPMVVR